MLKKILLGLAAIIALVLIVAAFQPADYRVERRIAIAAPASAIFSQIDDFHKWPAWSPWEKLDPAMKRTFAGAAGKGATYAWVGNDKVGEGKMTIVDSRPAERVTIKLEFIKPFPSTSETVFDFKPEGGQTAVVWTMTGRKNYLSKLVCLFMNMDKMVGGDFERGLAALKALVETKPAA